MQRMLAPTSSRNVRRGTRTGDARRVATRGGDRHRQVRHRGQSDRGQSDREESPTGDRHRCRDGRGQTPVGTAGDRHRRGRLGGRLGTAAGTDTGGAGVGMAGDRHRWKRLGTDTGVDDLGNDWGGNDGDRHPIASRLSLHGQTCNSSVLPGATWSAVF